MARAQRDIKFIMKNIIILSISYIILLTANTNKSDLLPGLLKEGDIIFQESLSDQSKAIKLATHSRYSHVGIIFKFNNQFQVLEAVQPVTITPLNKFINKGKNHHYVIKRLINYSSIIDQSAINKMKTYGKLFIGKNYDIYFEWSDERIYCSELVWKIYKNTLNIEIGKLEKLKDFDLNSTVVKNLMKKRYGTNIPYNELVISPESMFKSKYLLTVTSN